MTPAPSPFSPLGFTRAYQTYRAENAAIPFPDSRLLAAARFWSRYPQNLTSEAYATFWREDLPPLLTSVELQHFEDLHPDELGEIAQFIATLNPPRFESKVTSVSLWELAAKKWFYVGEASRAMDCLSRAGIGTVGWAQPTEHVDAIEIPRFLRAQLEELEGERTREPALALWLDRFDADWRATRESGHTNLATCVLVERDAAGHPIRGRLRTLEAWVEPLGKSHDSDEVVFGHQLRAADDPQVRGAYSALSAMRNAESNALQSAIRNPHSAFFRARFTFADSGREPYGGDSLGFACLISAYGDWWSKDLHRERRLISAGIALTGALNADSSAESVSESSLAKKVERVFFSPLTSLVVPKSNRDAAEVEVARLQAQYPARRLRVLTAERAIDLITDGNIMIPERVCLGEYAVRAAAKYSRSVKVQVPILAVLGYLLLCLLYPKAWPLFDDNPDHVEFYNSGLIVFNDEGQKLWSYDFGYRHDTTASLSRIGSVDDDPENEVFCLLGTREQELTPLVGKLFAFDDDGTLLFSRSAVITGEYPGDTSELQHYESHALEILRTRSGVRLFTGLSKWMPGRVHLKFWDTDGNLTGWYVNAGSCGGTEASRAILDSAAGILHVIGVNNRMHAACLFSIPLDSAHGVSPPYQDPDLDLTGVRHGNQFRYVIFPKTDLCNARSAEYNHALRLIQEAPQFYRFDVDELGGNRAVMDSNATVMYYLDGDWKLVDVRLADTYLTTRNEMVQQGVLPPIDLEAFRSELPRRVMYWADTGWATAAQPH